MKFLGHDGAHSFIKVHIVSIKSIIIHGVTRILVIGSDEGFAGILDHMTLLFCTPRGSRVCVEDPILRRFPKDLILSKFRILGYKIDGAASWGLWISALILSISLSTILFSSCY